MLTVHLGSGKLQLRKRPRPRRPQGYSLIRLLFGGICNTDIELLRGYYGFRGIPGHEFAGVVVESDRQELIGKRVVGEINLACGRCDFCRRGLGRHCPKRTVLGIVKHPGAFAEFLTLPDENLHVLPRSLKTEQAVFVEPLAAACGILDQTRIRRGERVAVLGDGKLGLLIAQVLSARGCEVHAYGRHRDKLDIARSAGAEIFVSVPKLPSAAYDWVVDATGSAEGLQSAVQMARPRGNVIMKSTVHGRVALDTAPVIVNEITLVGSRCGRFEPALQLLKSGKIQWERMLSAVYPLGQADKAFAAAQKRGTRKVLLENTEGEG